MFILRPFIYAYLVAVALGARRLPKMKGLFYALYSRIPNKKGIVRIKTVCGTTMYIDLADNIISTKLLEYGYWEKGLTDIVQKIVKPGMKVVDVGAHSGYYTLLFSKLVSATGSVVAFEPDAHNFKLLSANVSLNNATNCTLVNKAVSNLSGQLSLYRDPKNLGAHSLIEYEGEKKEKVTVEVTTLDEYWRGSSAPIDFIKMDIEGNEPMAFEGASKMLRANPNVILVVEFNSYIFDKIQRHPQQFIDMLRSFGMRLFTVPYDEGELREVHDLASIPTGAVVNLLCLKNPEVLTLCGISDIVF